MVRLLYTFVLISLTAIIIVGMDSCEDELRIGNLQTSEQIVDIQPTQDQTKHT